MLDTKAFFNESISAFEMYFAKRIESDMLCDAISKHLFLRREDIGIVALTQIDTKSTSVVIEETDGDFPFSVHVYTELTWLTISEQELAQKLCTTLETQCLISDNGENPYHWLLVSSNEIKGVFVDPEHFDGQCTFKVSSQL
jgi:hypothetical protein